MVSTGQYDVTPEAVRSIVGNVGGIIMQTMNSVLQLESMIVAPTSFATIGSAVASANTQMQGQQVTAMRSLLTLLQQVNNLVKSSVDAYDSADQAVATGYGGGQPGTTPTTTSGLWSSPAGAQVAGQAVSAGTGTAAAQPNSVSNVVGYLTAAGVGNQGTAAVPTSSPHDFVSWLDASPDNQAGLGVIGVYSGTARGFGDVPGGVHDGDMVVIDPGTGTSGAGTVLGVIGNSGQLYNNGLVQPDFGDVATLRVYRPM
ncbi:MAG TPA: WXG100 family type VII secretion target [Pseudonocardiaceae bacterium]|nr:WXG100 family type VII secretion target [Pseudonocardiaceae bacterium]